MIVNVRTYQQRQSAVFPIFVKVEDVVLCFKADFQRWIFKKKLAHW